MAIFVVRFSFNMLDGAVRSGVMDRQTPTLVSLRDAGRTASMRGSPSPIPLQAG